MTNQSSVLYHVTNVSTNDRDMSVNLDNLASYVSLVSHWLMFEGVSVQMEAVREGFNSVFPISSLSMFYPDELDQIFCGTVKSFLPWDYKVILETSKYV